MRMISKEDRVRGLRYMRSENGIENMETLNQRVIRVKSIKTELNLEVVR
jgi:hypothetical protein